MKGKKPIYGDDGVLTGYDIIDEIGLIREQKRVVRTETGQRVEQIEVYLEPDSPVRRDWLLFTDSPDEAMQIISLYEPVDIDGAVSHKKATL